MMWRVRTTLADRPGRLAALASACGDAGVNITTVQVLATDGGAVDEVVVETDDTWTDLAVARLFEDAGGTGVSVTRTAAEAVQDGPTRYLLAVREVIEEGRDVESTLRELLQTEPPDVADYRGHDVLDLSRRDGSVLRIVRAVPVPPV